MAIWKVLRVSSLAAALALSLSQSALSITAPSFTVFFDWNSEALSAQAHKTISQAANMYRDHQKRLRFIAMGHTDASEPDAERLSQRRAAVVKNVLREEGVSEEDIQVVGKGAKQPLVQVPPDKPEPQNRRVEIPYLWKN